MQNDNPTKYKRHIKYGKEVDFPSIPFSVGEYQKRDEQLTYITTLKRIEKAVADGALAVVDATTRVKQFGRPRKLYVVVTQTSKE